ncbi:hypothetical protein ACH5RR_027426 [Cinchona calisaya]|uniref:Glycolipid transfer protein domain-containing protein n=1 Tax=Cinchona calisaya TaxID=153742 RepID=A0ABD2Z5E3_9GENT
MEYVSKVQQLEDASEDYGTLNNVLDYAVEMDTTKLVESLSHNLLKVRQGLDFIRNHDILMQYQAGVSDFDDEVFSIIDV